MKEKKTNIAVSAFIVKDGKFLVLKRCNPPIKWCPPCGRAHEGETCIEAVVRESKEEANVNVKPLMPITFWAGEHGGEALTSIGFLCEYVSGDPKVSKEHTDIRWLDIEGLKNEELTHDIKDFIRAKEIKKLFDSGSIV